MTHAVNAANVPVLPSQNIYHSINDVYGLRSGTGLYNVATNRVYVTMEDHQIEDSSSVVVSGADHAGANGTFVITDDGPDLFYYTPTSAPPNPDNLADVPVTGNMLFGEENISYIFRMASAVFLSISGGATAEVQVKTAPYQQWFSIVATVAATSMIEFPVPYNFMRVVHTLPVAGALVVHAQGVYAQSLAGSPM